MFPILETQVGDGWVGDIDYTKQATKQDGNFLVDWVRVYQSEGQPVTRFDDLDGAESGAYRIAPASRTEGLTAVSNGDAAWRNKNNFYYGGQPRYETSRLMRVADATGEQSLTYKVPDVRDVHLTAYYQTLADKTVSTSAGSAGWSIRKSLVDGANIDFRVQTSTDDSTWQDFNGVKVVDNLMRCTRGMPAPRSMPLARPRGGRRTCVSCSRNSTGYAMRPRPGRGRWCRTPMCSSPRSRSCRSGARIRSRILTRSRIPIRMTARAMAQIRFALRLRGPQTLCRIRTNAFPAASDPLRVRLCRRIGEIAWRRDDVAVAVHNGAMPEIRNDTPAEPVGECAVPRVRALLSAWWEANARDLPWRFGRTTPWGVLVSEVMSQQTQMSRVVPYWTDWMRVWPDVTALAGASTAEVITAWGRLGYPRRALRLQECARVVFEQYHGRLPQTYDELTALPGIGDYTASAVLSFAFGVRIAVMDTNIRRVLSRVFLGVESRGGAASPAERALAGRVLPQDDETDVRDAIEAATARETVNAPEAAGRKMPQRSTRPSVIWNQSVMELGALVCTAKNPLCDQCPIGEHCAFLAAGRPGLGERRTRPRQRFQGTDRQVRGIILDALRAEPILARERLESLWPDHVQLDKCIASLDDDGLVDMLPDGSLRLPQ